MEKAVYIIGHKGRTFDGDWKIYFHAGMTDGVFDTTYDITKAVRYNSREELFDFLRNYCYLNGTIIFDLTEEYLERIKDNDRFKAIYNDCENY